MQKLRFKYSNFPPIFAVKTGRKTAEKHQNKHLKKEEKKVNKISSPLFSFKPKNGPGPLIVNAAFLSVYLSPLFVSSPLSRSLIRTLRFLNKILKYYPKCLPYSGKITTG